MSFRLVIAGLGSTAAALAALVAPVLAVPVSAATATTTATTTVNDVNVGSFNITSVSFDGSAAGDRRTWRERRPVVVDQIINQKMDVVGLQEANQSSIYASSLDYGSNQYLDLKGALSAKGARYALTNEYQYNCVKSTSSQNCVYQDREASQDNRILYNTDRVALVKQGSELFQTQTPNKNKRYLAWAVFQMKATGKQFFFTDTHLDPYSLTTRKAQWDESIVLTNRLKGTLPVVAVGDYNTSKFDDHAAVYLPKMKTNGYGDVLNQEYQRAYVRYPRAESKTLAWVNSYNGFNRDIRGYAYEDAKDKVGNGIDWIFASNALRVKKWAVVVRLSTTTNQLVGVIPSDHSLVKATLVL